MEGIEMVIKAQTPEFKGKGDVQVEHPDGSTQQKTHEVGGDKAASPHEQLAVVGVSLGQTLPTATKFHMIRVDVSVSIPCKPNEIDAVYDFALEWADGKMTALQASVKESYGS